MASTGRQTPNQILVFDVETTGLPQRRSWEPDVRFEVRADSDGTEIKRTVKAPHIVQLSWATMDAEGNISSPTSRIIRPDRWRVPEAAVRIHGITTQRAKKEGVPIGDALIEFTAALNEAEYVVAHNMRFDYHLLAAEYARLGWDNPLTGKPYYCTMEETAALCRIKAYHGEWKYPSLQELHRFLLGTNPRVSHDAAADVMTCAICFRELMRRGLVRFTSKDCGKVAGTDVRPPQSSGCLTSLAAGVAGFATVAAVIAVFLA